jgi:hypothetical protein
LRLQAVRREWVGGLAKDRGTPVSALGIGPG